MANTYTLIEAKTLGSNTASVTFSSIPQTYTDLLVKTSLRYTGTNAEAVKMLFNNSASNYTAKWAEGNGSSISSGSQFFQGIWIDTVGSSTNASTFTNAETYIPNYTGSNYKAASTHLVTENNATTAYMDIVAGLWSDSAAITSLVISPLQFSFLAGSTFYLYGIKNS
jgi:hypothetical protein